jgi:hypothetical protein
LNVALSQAIVTIDEVNYLPKCQPPIEAHSIINSSGVVAIFSEFWPNFPLVIPAYSTPLRIITDRSLWTGTHGKQ